MINERKIRNSKRAASNSGSREFSRSFGRAGATEKSPFASRFYRSEVEDDLLLGGEALEVDHKKTKRAHSSFPLKVFPKCYS
jgi:hypothetical protein